MMFDVNPNTENVVSAIYKTLLNTLVPALKACSGWGDINPPNPKSESIIKHYLSQIMMFIDYLASEFFFA